MTGKHDIVKLFANPRTEPVLAIFLGIVSAYLMFVNLDAAAFWHDEGTNAIMARALATTGTLTGWDGRNLFFGSTDVVYKQLYAITNDLTIAYPPWPAVPSALGILLFGDGEFGVRFPHALLGALCLPVFYAILRRHFPDSPRLRMMTFALLALSPIFILYARQGRYYPDAILFSLLAFYFYQRYKDKTGNPLVSLAGVCIFTILNFLNHYTVGFVFALSLAIWHLIYFWRETTKRQWLELSAAGIVCGGVCLSWLLWNELIGSGTRLEYGEGFYRLPWLERHIYLLWFYLRDFVRTGWLPLWVALWWLWHASDGVLFNRQTVKKGGCKHKVASAMTSAVAVRQWAVLAVLVVVIGSLTSVQPAADHSLADMRYLLPALPFAVLMCAAFVNWAWSKDKIFGGAMFAILAFSNFAGHPFIVQSTLCLGGFNTNYSVSTPVPLMALAREIHRPYPTGISETVAYLREHAQQDDTIFVWEWEDSTVFLYYLTDQLIFCCGLPSDATLPKEKIRELGVPIYVDDGVPDWFVNMDRPRPTPDGYEQVKVGEYYTSPTNRPELEYHCFDPGDHRPRAKIYKRIAS